MWILDWGAIVSNVVSMMLSGRTCLFNAFSLGRTHTVDNLCLKGFYVLYFTTLLAFAQFKVLNCRVNKSSAVIWTKRKANATFYTMQ